MIGDDEDREAVGDQLSDPERSHAHAAHGDGGITEP